MSRYGAAKMAGVGSGKPASEMAAAIAAAKELVCGTIGP